MLIFFPYRIEAIYQRPPIANYVIIGITCLVSLAALFLSDDLITLLLLDSSNLPGLLGHLLLHGSVMHLLSNMLILWIFGNVLSANMQPVRYASLYVLLGVLAGLSHMLMDGAPAIGASGAVSGVVGMALAVYPKDRVDVFYWVLIRFGSWSAPIWGLALVWLFFDLWGASSGDEQIAYWAHIGGLLAGIGVGLFALRSGWIQLTQFDKPTLLDLLRKTSPSTRE